MCSCPHTFASSANTVWGRERTRRWADLAKAQNFGRFLCERSTTKARHWERFHCLKRNEKQDGERRHSAREEEESCWTSSGAVGQRWEAEDGKSHEIVWQRLSRRFCKTLRGGDECEFATGAKCFRFDRRAGRHEHLAWAAHWQDHSVAPPRGNAVHNVAWIIRW